MNKVLLVSPRFPPYNAPDMHRVRHALAYLTTFGWSSSVVCVDSNAMGVSDPLLLATIPEKTEIVRATCYSNSVMFRAAGIGSLSVRAWRGLDAAGRRLLQSGTISLAYFSTTAFGIFPLARAWKRRFRIPYVLDFQDPWINDYYFRTRVRPPGGWMKHRVHQWMARQLEPACVREASEITCVSPSYREMLLNRYPYKNPDSIHVLPFGGAKQDFEILSRVDDFKESVKQRFDPQYKHWLYAGVAGPYMAFALRGFFAAFARALRESPDQYEKVRLHFVGTDYAASGTGQKRVLPLAAEFELSEYVREQTDRVPYFEVLRLLSQADALIVPGSDDPKYTASKLYPYILANRPLLAIFHANSPVCRVLDSTAAGCSVTFESGVTQESLANNIYNAWFATRRYEQRPATNWGQFAPYTAEEMTKRLAAIFDRAVAGISQ